MGKVSIRIPLSKVLAGDYKVGLTPRDSSAKTAVSLPELVQQTNAFSTKHRPGCVPKLEKSDPKALFLQYRVTCHNEDYNDPKGHETRVQFDVSKIAEDQDANDLDIQCSCSCPAFLYWGAQWNLHQRDGLLGEPRPKLQAPTERLDLRGNFVICKHCKAVFERILPSVQHNIENINRKKKVDENKKKQQPTPTMKRQPAPEPQEEEEDIEELQQAEKQKMLDDQGIITRQTPATNEEKAKHPTINETPAKKEPRWRKTIDDLKNRVKKWMPSQEQKPENEDDRVQQELLEEEKQKLNEPFEQEHPSGGHVDKGLPYVPRWKKVIKDLKNRVKTWGKK